MIDEQRTLEKFGYTSDELSYGSHKPIIRVCDKCGKIQNIMFHNYNKSKYPNLCLQCVAKLLEVRKKISNSTKDKIVSLKTRKKMSKISKHRTYSQKTREKMSRNHRDVSGKNNPHYGKFGKLASNWKGGISGNRDHIKPVKSCTKLNTYFKGSHGHHIISGIVIFIPQDLHQSIRHNLKTGKNMKEINILAIDYLLHPKYNHPAASRSHLM